MFVTNNISPSPLIVLLGNGNGSFQAKMTNDVGWSVAGAISDFNNDGKLDVVVSIGVSVTI